MGYYHLPQDLQWPGKGNFTSYAAAFVFFLNSLYIQLEEYGKVHNSYQHVYEEDFHKPLRQTNISQEEYISKVSNFYERTHEGAFEVISLETDHLGVGITGINGSKTSVDVKIYIDFDHQELLKLKQYSPEQVYSVEIRMLIPALDPYAWSFSPYPERQYNLTIYSEYSNNYNRLSEHKVWLPPTKAKWISISSKSLFRDVRLWRASEKRLGHFRISGIPIYPMRAFLNVVLNYYPLNVCPSVFKHMGTFNYVLRNVHIDMKNLKHSGCEWVRSTLNNERGCYRNKIPFDSSYMDQFGLDMSLLTQNFYAPAGLTYSFCDKMGTRDQVNCVPKEYSEDTVLTAGWNSETRELLEVTDSSQLTILGCNQCFC